MHFERYPVFCIFLAATPAFCLCPCFWRGHFHFYDSFGAILT